MALPLRLAASNRLGWAPGAGSAPSLTSTIQTPQRDQSNLDASKPIYRAKGQSPNQGHSPSRVYALNGGAQPPPHIGRQSREGN